MHLTLVQLFKRTVPGHIFRGKRRLVKEVTSYDITLLKRDYEMQEKNMQLLRHPYLTLKESSGHVKALNKPNQYIEKIQNVKIMKRMKPHVTLEDRLNHLKVKECWE